MLKTGDRAMSRGKKIERERDFPLPSQERMTVEELQLMRRLLGLYEIGEGYEQLEMSLRFGYGASWWNNLEVRGREPKGLRAMLFRIVLKSLEDAYREGEGFVAMPNLDMLRERVADD